MARPAFGSLSRKWSENPDAEELIRKYAPKVQIKARCQDRSYPGEDFEPHYMDGLYMAAYTFADARPGTQWDLWLFFHIRRNNKGPMYRIHRTTAKLGSRKQYEDKGVEERLSYEHVQ